MTERYLEDFAVGQTFSFGCSRIDEERIKSFAAEFDPQPFHLDPTAAQHSIFRALPRAVGISLPSPCVFWLKAS